MTVGIALKSYNELPHLAVLSSFSNYGLCPEGPPSSFSSNKSEKIVPSLFQILFHYLLLNVQIFVSYPVQFTPVVNYLP